MFWHYFGSRSAFPSFHRDGRQQRNYSEPFRPRNADAVLWRAASGVLRLSTLVKWWTHLLMRRGNLMPTADPACELPVSKANVFQLELTRNPHLDGGRDAPTGSWPDRSLIYDRYRRYREVRQDLLPSSTTGSSGSIAPTHDSNEVTAFEATHERWTVRSGDC